MSDNRTRYPEIAAVIDEWRSTLLLHGGNAKFRWTDGTQSFAWKEPNRGDLDAALEAAGMDKAWCAQQRCAMRGGKK